jgi:acetolactate synthase small subunit
MNSRQLNQLEKDISQILYNASEYKNMDAPEDECDRYAQYVAIRASVEGAKGEQDIQTILDVFKGSEIDVSNLSAKIWPLIIQNKDS